MSDDYTRLSNREYEVLLLLANGGMNNAIAYSLGISDKTVQVHIKNLKMKLGAQTRAHAILIAVRNQIIELENNEEE